ncbi:MAG: nucleotide sugar dehydrogenase [Chitinophagia bacterium]
MINNKHKISVIGLGYVGLPLAVEFGKKFKVIGYDINKSRITELKNGIDRTNETTKNQLDESVYLNLSSEEEELKDSTIFIVTVPTPIDKNNNPNINLLLSASKTIAKYLKKNDIVIYESTVYPGCTEEDCVPVLEEYSGLFFNKDFFCGYSPERINPGDKINTLTKIKKVTSGSTPEIANIVDELYNNIIEAGTYKASSIKVAEASKAIENSQRDLNISFVNELALIFDRLGIDTTEVLEAAATKWNFLNFKPGLVGGHCIGVDPYYLAFKAQAAGYHPQVILSGRRVNDNMGLFIANKVVKLMINKNSIIKGGRVLILGFTFKENCGDIRNSKVIDIYNELVLFGLNVDIYDPLVDSDELYHEYGIKTINKLEKYDCIILAVSHNDFKSLEITKLQKDKNTVVYDVKSFLSRDLIDSRL